MAFREHHIIGARSAIEGIGPEHVYALAMRLRDGTIQVQILRHIDNMLNPISLAEHPYYNSSWDQVNEFLEKVFTARPENIIRLSDWYLFDHLSLSRIIERSLVTESVE